MLFGKWSQVPAYDLSNYIETRLYFICLSHFHLFKNQSYIEHPLGTHLSNAKYAINTNAYDNQNSVFLEIKTLCQKVTNSCQ